MARGGTIKEQIKHVKDELDKEEKRWRDADLPGPKLFYQFGDDQLMHHVHVLALTELLKEKGIATEDEIELKLNTIFLQEVQEMFEPVLEMKRQAARAAIVKGVNPLNPPNRIKPEI